jgi:hypothetical protein
MKITMDVFTGKQGNSCNFGNLDNLSSNITIVNGRIISGEGYSTETKKINETKRVRSEGINKITVDSSLADVTIAVGNTTDVEVFYNGEVCTDGKLQFDVATSADEVSVFAIINGSTFNMNRLKLKILVPKKEFKLISVKSQNGSAEFCKDVAAERIRLNLQNGSIKSEAAFKKIIAKSMNGNIDIDVIAKSDIAISADSTNGNVGVKLKNIGDCNISTSSMNGFVRNCHNSTGKYKATGNVSSMNGNVTVQ